MAGLLEYKCPCCGGAIEFNSEIQKMKCPYCDTEFELDTLKNYDNELSSDAPDEMKWENMPGSEWGEGETDGMRVYVCKSCGGEIIGDANMAATSCPYCGNPVMMMGNFKGDLKPDYVIPFKLNKEQAKEAYLNHLSGKKLLPKVFKDDNHIDEIKGIYVPFWLFNAKANGRMRYRAAKYRRYQDQHYLYNEVSYYSVNRFGSLNFEHVPVDGSEKMDDTLMQSLEPFNFKDAVDFQTAYLAGYLADKYDVNREKSVEAANDRIKTTTQQVFDSTVQGYDEVQAESRSIQLSDGSAKYALYPVWLLNTTWNGEQYTFAMNGQTGKFVGDLPVDEKVYKAHFIRTALITAAIIYGLSWLFMFF